MSVLLPPGSPMYKSHAGMFGVKGSSDERGPNGCEPQLGDTLRQRACLSKNPQLTRGAMVAAQRRTVPKGAILQGAERLPERQRRPQVHGQCANLPHTLNLHLHILDLQCPWHVVACLVRTATDQLLLLLPAAGRSERAAAGSRLRSGDRRACAGAKRQVLRLRNKQ